MEPVTAVEGEDQRWRRSNTDCVSFLASRFACTKGSSCEFRHCEGARFNPSCWYWFRGNCVNPSCTFRHPPLESLNRTKPLADPLLSCASSSIKAANPCYFYYNSYCKKGDTCPFLHEPITRNDVVGVSSEALTSNLAKNSNPAGNEMIESLNDALTNPCHGNPDRSKDHQPGVPASSSPKHNGLILNAPQTSVDTVGYMKRSALSDQISGDSAIEHAEQDTSRDSSPGFDVLVDDGFSDMIDLEHQSTQERDTEVLHVKYRVGDSIAYGLDYHDEEYNEQGLHGFEHDSCLDYFEGVQGHDCLTTSGHILHNRINLVNPSCEEHVPRFFNPSSLMGSHAGSDHQNSQIGHISKRPRERRGAKGNNGRIKRFRIHEGRNGSEEIDTRPTHDMQKSLIGNGSQPLACATFRGQKKKSRRKQRYVRSARPSKYSTANVKRLDLEDFIGPKTLAQIKEEKRRSKSSASHPTVHMPHGRSSSNDFEGPKSLSELLKVKGGLLLMGNHVVASNYNRTQNDVTDSHLCYHNKQHGDTSFKEHGKW